MNMISNNNQVLVLEDLAVYVLTAQGLLLASRLTKKFNIHIFAPVALSSRSNLLVKPEIQLTLFQALGQEVITQFNNFKAHLFIGACGIAVRVIAPLIQTKDKDPAVLVLDQQARYVISLLSGHLGGANKLAEAIAAEVGACPVITTATDIEDIPSIDMMAQEHNLSIGNIQTVKVISAELLAGNRVSISDPDNRLRIKGSDFDKYFENIPPGIHTVGKCKVSIRVTESFVDYSDLELVLHPRTLYVGIGCRRSVSASIILHALKSVLESYGFALSSTACLASLDVKKDEAGLLKAAESLGIPVLFFSASELQNFSVSRFSQKAQEMFGVKGVCEPSALAACQKVCCDNCNLIIPKTIVDGVTIAMARQRSDRVS